MNPYRYGLREYGCDKSSAKCLVSRYTCTTNLRGFRALSRATF